MQAKVIPIIMNEARLTAQTVDFQKKKNFKKYLLAIIYPMVVAKGLKDGTVHLFQFQN